MWAVHSCNSWLSDLSDDDPQSYKNYLGIDLDHFNELLRSCFSVFKNIQKLFYIYYFYSFISG